MVTEVASIYLASQGVHCLSRHRALSVPVSSCKTQVASSGFDVGVLILAEKLLLCDSISNGACSLCGLEAFSTMCLAKLDVLLDHVFLDSLVFSKLTTQLHLW